MKSVGEVMAIGRSFEEVFQKAIRMLNTPLDKKYLTGQVGAYLEEIEHPTANSVFAIFGAMRLGVSVKKIHELSNIDPWFLYKIKNIVDFEKRLPRSHLGREMLRRAKQLGFSD